MSENENSGETPGALALAEHQDLAPVAPQHPAVNSYTVSQLVTLSKLVSDALTLPKALQGKPADWGDDEATAWEGEYQPFEDPKESPLDFHGKPWRPGITISAGRVP